MWSYCSLHFGQHFVVVVVVGGGAAAFAVKFEIVLVTVVVGILFSEF